MEPQFPHLKVSGNMVETTFNPQINLKNEFRQGDR